MRARHVPLDPPRATAYSFAVRVRAHRGAIAQLGERLNGIQEVGGSIPPGSTIFPGNSLKLIFARGAGASA